MGKTVGIFGGSFDPIHKGHTRLASYIVESGVADEVWLMVSPLNPLKSDRPPVGFEDRMEMARLATKDIPGVIPSDFEAGLPLPSYTYRTLEALAEAHPDVRFHLIIGADNWKAFDRWKNPEEILDRFSPIVYPRPGVEIDETTLPPELTYLSSAPLTDISSTELRALLRDPSAPFPETIDHAVASYARSRRLY